MRRSSTSHSECAAIVTTALHAQGMNDIPDQLRGRAFTHSDAERLGVTRRMLQGKRFAQIHPGVYRTRATDPTLRLLICAARLVLPDDAAVSHTTNLRLRGLGIGPELPLHFSTNTIPEVDRRGIKLHRRRATFQTIDVAGVPALGPRRTFVDVATQLDDRRLLRVGDWIVGSGLVALPELRQYVAECHLDGVRRARRVAPLVADSVASPRESDLRWALHRAGLPHPEVNVDIHDVHGHWLARGDLVYRQWKVLVEYDGWQHERDAWQRQRDHLRREALEAAGWRIIVITAADMANERSVIIRVRQALRQRGRVG